MNIPAKTVLIAALAAALQLAAASSQAQGNLTISCTSRHLPSQQAVGRTLGLNNFGQVYVARERLMQDVERACRKGATQVVVSTDNPTKPPYGPSAARRVAGTSNQSANTELH